MPISCTTDDAFLGLLRENQFTGFRVLGPTMERILIDQFHRSFFGDGGLYWEDDDASLEAVAGFEAEIRASSLASVISANTGASIDGDGFTVGRGIFGGSNGSSVSVTRRVTRG